MSYRIYLSPPHMGKEELEYINKAFAANWVAPAGPQLEAFEKALCTYNGISHAVALSSGTAAIHLALKVLNVKPGDDVLCSSFTFAGSCNPIVYEGANPVFIDSEPETWNIDPELLAKAIEDRISRTKRKPAALIVVHLYGMPAKIKEIMDIANRFEIPVIEDAAEALGSTYDGRKLGSYGHLGVFSFNGNKIITTSGGGALVSENKSWIDSARFLATQARDKAPHYQHSHIGYNYRLSNICAGIGLGQLEKIDLRVSQRRSVFNQYANALARPGISFQNEIKGAFSNRWLTTILLKDSASPERLRVALDTARIEARPLWKPMHLQPVFQTAPSYLNGTSEKLFNTGLCLPSGSGLSESEIHDVVKIVDQNL